MDETLEARIAAALSDDTITSAAIGELLAETESAITQADQDAEQARVRALDPALSPDPKKARQEMEDAAFACDRLKTLLPRLQRRLVQVKHNEEKTRWIAVYDELIPRRDALADELRTIYTEFAPKVADALTRALKIDREITRARQTKPFPQAGEAPDGRELTMVEAFARGFTHLDGENHLTLVRDMILPDWSNPEKRIWPPYENILTPEEQHLDLEAWHLAQEHLEQAKYASWQREAERREAQQAKERARQAYRERGLPSG
jgi:hypothetical protein